MADASTACRSAAELEKFISRVLPMEEVEDLACHVAECERCAQTVDCLLDRDTLAETMWSQGNVAQETPSPLLPDLMDRLLTLRPSAGTGEEVSPDPLSFLAPPEGPDEIGRLGPYRVLKVLGAGGMGVVCEAEDTQLKRAVALKVMKPALASNSSGRRRFLREAQAAASVKHDHVVTIYQVGEDPPFLAMELLQGESLGDRLQRQGRLPIAEVVRVGREVAEGLTAIHERGLVHRDIKPSNIWLEAHGSQSVGLGRVKILDFGIARPDQGDATVTGTDQVVGTPAYIAPEQARGEKTDHRADLFSFGCVLYHLCTGRLPFRGDTSMAMLTSLAVDSPEPVESIVADLPPGLSQLIMRLLAKNPADRPPSAQAVVEALSAIERELLVRSAGFSPCPAQPAEASTTSKLARRRRRRRLILVVVAAVVLLAVSGPVAQVIIRIRYPDGTEKDIPAPPGTTAKVIEDAAKAKTKPNPFDAFHRDQLTNEELAAVGGGDAKNAPAELVGILGDGRDDSAVVSLALHPDGKHLVWGDRAGTVRVWDLFARKEVATFPGERSADSLSFSADGGRLATNLWKSGPAVFDAALVPMLLKRPVRHFKGYDPRSLALSPDGQLLAAVGSDKVMLLDVDSGKELMTMEHGPKINGVAYTSDGARLASASTDGTAKVWDARSGRNLHTLPGVGGPLHVVAFSRDGTRLTAAGRGGQFKIWDAVTGQEIVTCTFAKRFATSVTAIAFNADGSLVVAGDLGSRVTIWNSRSAQIVYDWKLLHRVWSVLFTPDGRHLLLGNDNGAIHVLRLHNR